MELISLTSKNFQDAIGIAAKILKNGGVVMAPTDTVYGLLADATNEAAIKKIYGAKKRSLEKPLPIFVKNMAMAKKLAAINLRQQKILDEIWPGKFTAVLKRKNGIKIFGVARDTVGLRIPFYPFINSLLETFNQPLAGTSANISGQATSTKIDDILRQFASEKILPDIVLNAGDLPESKPSAIVDLMAQEIKIIR